MMCRHIWVFSTEKINETLHKAVCSRCSYIDERLITAGIKPNQELFLEIINKDKNKSNLLKELIANENDGHMRHWKRVRQFILDHTENSGL